MRLLVLTVASGVVTGVLAIGTVFAQAGPTWRIVQGSDDSLYLLAGYVKYEITPDAVSDDDLAALQDGGPIGSQPPALATTSAPSPAGGTPSSPQPQTQPTPLPVPSGPGVVGGDFRVSVVSVQRPFTPAGCQLDKGMELALVRVRYENLTAGRLRLGDTSDFRAQLPGGVTREPGNACFFFGWSKFPDGLNGMDLFPGTANEGNLVFTLPVGLPLAKVLYQSNNYPQPVEVPLP